jgi:hypothetical protein
VKDKLAFARLPILLFVIFFVVRLAIGAGMGVNKASFDIANRMVSMVILQVHVGLLWGAAGRLRGYRIGGSVQTVAIAVLASQVLIVLGTAVSYVAGIDTLFNYPEALNQQVAVGFGAAMVARTITLIVNIIIGSILGAVGWALGGIVPVQSRTV